MFRNYLAAALRNLVRNKLYAAINIVGLAVGFAAALLIALFVRDEFSYDRMFPDYERIYLLGDTMTIGGSRTEYADLSPGTLGPLLRIDFPMVEVARLAPDTRVIRRGDNENTESLFWGDSNIFDIFKFSEVAGHLDGALTKPDSVVITRKMALKYFGAESPIGQTLELNRKTPYTVTAVIEDLPSNTHIDLDFIFSATSWESRMSLNYIKVPSADVALQVDAGLNEFVKRHLPGNVGPEAALRVELYLKPIASVHFSPGAGGTWVVKPRGNKDTILSIAAVGVLIIVSASVNFVNLMTARAARRAREVGVRKATGAYRSDLVVQFLGEALIYVCISMALGFAVAAAMLSSLNTFLGRTIELGLYIDIPSLAFIIGMALLVGVLAGLHPATVLSSFRPATVLKAAAHQSMASETVRQGLVILQFAVVIGLLISSAVVYRQTQFALTEAQRLESDQVVVVRAQCRGAFKEAVGAISGVRAVTCGGSEVIDIREDEFAPPTRAADGTMILMSRHQIGIGFLEFFGLKPVAGRFFDEDHPSDLTSTDRKAAVQGNVILNETAVLRLGYRSPEESIGKRTTTFGGESEIIGVVPDFSVDPVRKAIQPIVYGTWPALDFIYLRIDGARLPETLADVDKLWRQVGDPRPVSRFFFNEFVAGLFQDVSRQGTLLAIFAGVAIFIALLGLFGVAAFTAERRTKEIGIRKAMGATRAELVQLLLWQFTKPVLWANVIAWPAGYFLTQRWLEGFVLHIDLSPWMFLAASGLAVVIAVATVIGHALLVARAQPVNALRYE